MQNFEHSPTVKRKRFLINFAFFALIFALSVVLVRYALPALFPFVVAYIVTAILLPPVRLINSKLKINKRILSVVLVILFYGTIGVIVIWLLIELVSFAADQIKDLPAFFQSQVRPFLVNLFDQIQEMLYNLDPEMAIDFDTTANSILSSLGSTVMSISGTVVGKLTDFAVSVPSFLLNIIIMIIATIFGSIICLTTQRIAQRMKSPMPAPISPMMKQMIAHGTITSPDPTTGRMSNTAISTAISAECLKPIIESPKKISAKVISIISE